MIRLSLNGNGKRPFQVLCLGCHSDDIEIGCGGAILKIAEEYPQCIFHWVVFSATGVREEEARRAACLFAGPERLRGPLLKSFPDGFLPYVGGEVKAVFEELKQGISPDLIFTHNGKDAHQDHRLVSELTWNTFRDHMILEYEIPKYDGDMGAPNFFVPLEDGIYRKKLDLLFEVFHSQQEKHWFRRETFLGLMRLRGMECNAPSGYAEGFYSKKAMF
jgi:LmbE family N-acetylglucosaminyl deacetylase